jgi:23S rRNA G2445 N2-methylase RlmL
VGSKSNLSNRKSSFLSGPQRAVFVPARSALDECHQEVVQWLPQRRFKGKFEPSISLHSDHVSIENCDFRTLLEAAVTLVTASDIRWEIAAFKADTLAKFKKGLARVPWPEPSLIKAWKVKTSSINSRLYHEGRLTDIAESCLSASNQPKPDTAHRRTQAVFLQVDNNLVHVLLSMRGYQAHRRSYLTAPRSIASMRAPLVAAILRWGIQSIREIERHEVDRTIECIWNPFAGSGTFAIECAAQLLQIPHRTLTNAYAWEDWDFVPESTKAFFLRPIPPILTDDLRLELEDIDPTQMTAAAEHLTHFSNQPQPIVSQASCRNFFDGTREFLQRPTVLCANPPWGMRLKTAAGSTRFFASIGERLQQLERTHGGLSAGILIAPTQNAANAFCRGLGAEFHYRTKSYRSGGKLIVALAFAKNSI